MPILKIPFHGCETLPFSASQAGQDLFVLGLLNGKKNGTYLEIGAGPAVGGNNSYILETYYGWKGASVEIDSMLYNDHKEKRNHHIELADATTMDYYKLLGQAGITTTNIDYASVDCDPPCNTFQALTRLPFDTHKFAVLTFEHDSYSWGPEYKYKSRAFLRSKGYELVVTNIRPSDLMFGDFEDWWVHPDLVNPTTVQQFKNTDETVKEWTSILFL